MKRFILATFAILFIALPASASAFCGFYVGGGGAELFNDATQVVLLREGTTTTLSMQNSYDGPASDFAMVVPVPQVLMQGDVKTLETSLFDKVDTLTAPRLVEYYEQDPCGWEDYVNASSNNAFFADAGAVENVDGGTVTVEAQFKEGEYEISVLSATESTALETYLADNNYNVPAGAAPYYQPYIDSGMYFFVAKVDPAEVTFDSNGKAVLSPLRFQYDSPEFSLPIRLGMLNSAGQQDLIVYVLAQNQRYDVANYPTTTIPTNFEVTDAVVDDFGTFYKSLFARTLKENPGAVVTEYSWASAQCDPCPTGFQGAAAQLGPEDLLSFGADDLGFGWVVTRLHARYDKDEVGEDLVFAKADAIVGGRERDEDNDGEIDQGAFPSSFNNFQGRYIIRRPWTGPVNCEEPRWGDWGPPAVDAESSPNTSGAPVFGGDPDSVGSLVSQDIEELGITATGEAPAGVSRDKASAGGCSTGAPNALAPLGLLLAFGLVLRRRRGRDSAASEI